MKITVKFEYKQSFLPNKKCRKPRYRMVNGIERVEVTEPSEAEFPIALITHDYQTWFEKNTSNSFQRVARPYRYYGGQLWRQLRASDYQMEAEGYLSVAEIKNISLNCYSSYADDDEEFDPEKSVITGDDRQDMVELAQQKANSLKVFDGGVWQVIGEPIYRITTFGLGHNHGGIGTDLGIFNGYNSNIGKDNYFNALEFDKAVKQAKKIALGRGDTESVDLIGKDYIEVLLPEAIKADPQKEAGDGDGFMNKLEKVISQSDSVMESGIGVIAETMMEANK